MSRQTSNMSLHYLVKCLCLKSSCPRAEKYSSNDVSAISVQWRNTFAVVAPENPETDGLYAYPSTKKKDVVRKRLYTRNERSVGESQVVESRFVNTINRYTMLLQQFLPVIVRYQETSSSVSRAVPRHIRRLRHSTFPRTFRNVKRFAQFFQNRPNSKFVIAYSNGQTSH